MVNKNFIGFFPPLPKKKEEERPAQDKITWKYEIVGPPVHEPTAYRRAAPEPVVTETVIRQRWSDRLRAQQMSQHHRCTTQHVPEPEAFPVFIVEEKKKKEEKKKEERKKDVRPIHIHINKSPEKPKAPPQPRFVFNGHEFPFQFACPPPPKDDPPPGPTFILAPHLKEKDKKKEEPPAPAAALVPCPQWETTGKILSVILLLIILWAIMETVGRVASAVMTPFRMVLASPYGQGQQYMSGAPPVYHAQPYPPQGWQHHDHHHAHQYRRG